MSDRGGLGTVQRLASGRWRARLPPRLRKVTVGTYDTEEEALQALRAALESATYRSARTLRAWGEVWLKRRAARGLSSYSDDVSRWAQHVLASKLAEREVKGIQPRDVAAFARWLSTRPKAVQGRGGTWERPEGGDTLSRQTQQHVLKLLQLALAEAAIEGWCASNAAADVRPVHGQAAARERRHLNPAQIAGLLEQPDEVIPWEVRQLYAVAIYSGLRPGELWALRWQDVHLDERPRLRVRAAVKKTGEEGAPKSGKARTVPLLGPALAALRALRSAQGPAALVFPSALGRQRRTGDDAGWADRSRGSKGITEGYRRKAGLPDDLDFYAMRHTCATALLHGWWGRRWSIAEVRAWLGHSSVVVTQRYLHEDEAALLDAATEALEGGAVMIHTPPPQPHAPGAEAPAADHEADHGTPDLGGSVAVGAPGRSRTCDPRLRRPDGFRRWQGVYGRVVVGCLSRLSAPV